MFVRLPQSARAVGRQGSLMPVMAVALFACGACLALVLNQYWLSDAQEELRTVAQSSALAGARQLACDDRLKPDFDSYENAEHVREIVRRQSLSNPVSGRVPAKVDVLLGKTHLDPLTGRQDSEETDDFPTSVLVVAHRDNRSGNPVGMIAPAFTGRIGADVTVKTEASISNVIAALRPVGTGKVPAWPLAILGMSDDDIVQSWNRQIELRLGKDEYGWDDVNHVVTDEPDGLPEISLIQQTDDLPGNVCLVDIGSHLDREILNRQFRDGWSVEDLERWNGEFSVADLPQLIPGSTSLQQIDSSLLEQQIGAARILMLYRSIKALKGGDIQVDVSRVVGARLMAVRQAEGILELVFQPAVIVTRTAVIDDDALYRGVTSGNPYIYRISLTN